MTVGSAEHPPPKRGIPAEPDGGPETAKVFAGVDVIPGPSSGPDETGRIVRAAVAMLALLAS